MNMSLFPKCTLVELLDAIVASQCSSDFMKCIIFLRFHKEQFDKSNVKLHLTDYNCTENFSHNESTHSCINETLKSGSSFSSLSNDDNESLTTNMHSSAYENVILDKNDNEGFYLTSNISQQLAQAINNSQSEFIIIIHIFFCGWLLF
ncbi:hypothetical protein Smp_174550 [Schistosoma mansoni]|uniref:hypothetical protein n=1 Tax=Schistosoma mansoni TaxID=6183 RepID=UPI00022DCA92|nr:hypothetical protein Smp_174550 [Schistosoma mansoni]|eukprot:XP_018655357.1 hypothetical protein Smp_174550 [Schistosoma mansoni]